MSNKFYNFREDKVSKKQKKKQKNLAVGSCSDPVAFEATYFDENQPAFQKNILPPSSLSKCKTSENRP
jgi:hypothetical protein